MIHASHSSPDAFFQHLSRVDGKIFYGYNDGFAIRNSLWEGLTITEYSKGWWNPMKYSMSADQKRKTAENIARVFKYNALRIAAGEIPNTSTDQILSVLERYQKMQVSSIQDSADRSRVHQSYQKAIDALKNVMDSREIDVIKKIVSPKGKIRWGAEKFIDQFSKGFFITRPNFRFYLRSEGREIIPYTIRKLFWIEKLFYGRAASSAEKIAMVQNLHALFRGHLNDLIAQRADIRAIQANVSRLTEKMKHNMSDEEITQLESAVESLQTQLHYAQELIDQNISFNPLLALWGGIKWTVSAPLRMTKWVVWDQAIFPLASRIETNAHNLVGWVSSPFVFLAHKVNAVFQYAISEVTDAVKRVVSPPVRLVARVLEGGVYLVKTPVRLLNNFVQATC